jgi:hypothetical protein
VTQRYPYNHKKTITFSKNTSVIPDGDRESSRDRTSRKIFRARWAALTRISPMLVKNAGQAAFLLNVKIELVNSDAFEEVEDAVEIAVEDVFLRAVERDQFERGVDFFYGAPEILFGFQRQFA